MKKAETTVEMIFVMGGISNEKKKPYLQLSNQIEAKFMRIHKDFQVEKDTFSDLEKGETVFVSIETDGIEVAVKGIEKL